MKKDLGKEPKDSASKSELRSRIIKAAGEAFSTHGIKSIRMDDIAAGLSISKRTLYEIFNDKEELLLEVINKNAAEMDVYFQEILANSENVLEVILKGYQKTLEIYHKTDRKFFEDMQKYPHVQKLIEQKRKRDEEGTVEFFARGVEQGIFRDDVRFDIVLLLVREQVKVLMGTDLCTKYTFEEVYSSIMFTFMRGISTEKGAKILEDFIRQSKEQSENKEN